MEILWNLFGLLIFLGLSAAIAYLICKYLLKKAGHGRKNNAETA